MYNFTQNVKLKTIFSFRKMLFFRNKYFCCVIKFINIFFLVIFISFIALPTVAFAADADVSLTTMNMAEEEENHKKPSNNFNEEEVKYFHDFSFDGLFLSVQNNNTSDLIVKLFLKKDLVSKIPLPPPERV